MQLEVIFTFDGSPQQIVTYPFVEALLQTRTLFFNYVTAMLNDEEKETLCKISCCIYSFEQMHPLSNEHWYSQTNGKFYDAEIIHYMKKALDIDSKIEPINNLAQFELFV